MTPLRCGNHIWTLPHQKTLLMANLEELPELSVVLDGAVVHDDELVPIVGRVRVRVGVAHLAVRRPPARTATVRKIPRSKSTKGGLRGLPIFVENMGKLWKMLGKHLQCPL